MQRKMDLTVKNCKKAKKTVATKKRGETEKPCEILSNQVKECNKILLLA
jgi:hypothetical protein